MGGLVLAISISTIFAQDDNQISAQEPTDTKVMLQAIAEASPNTYLFPEGVPLYVGLYTGEGFPPGGVCPNPLFGWAQLVNNGGVIELLDGALAYGAGGIYVGTTTLTTVPEPSALSLALLGIMTLRRGRRATRY